MRPGTTTVRLGARPKWGPRRYTADRELWARKTGLQRRYPHFDRAPNLTLHRGVGVILI